jgi:hypothetical protein
MDFGLPSTKPPAKRGFVVGLSVPGPDPISGANDDQPG